MATQPQALGIDLDFNPKLFNPLYWKIKECSSRVVLNKGGAGSGKSYAAAQNEVMKGLESRQKTMVVRKVGSTLKDSVIPLFKDSIIGNWGLSDLFVFNKQDNTLTNQHNGSQFIFRGVDDPEKMKSIEGLTRMFIEELSEFEERDFNQLKLRLRGKSNQQIVCCFNPISEYLWVKPRFFDRTEANTTIFETTYKDNNFLDQDYINDLEALIDVDPVFHQIYVRNEWGIEDKSNKFAYNFDAHKHVGHVPINPDIPYIYLSFDFNVDPISCGVIQRTEGKIRVVEAIKLPNSDIYEMCDYIKANYGNYIPIVTGDATGKNRSAMVKDKVNYYIIIREQLGLNDNQIQVPASNPPLVENKVLVNAVIRNLDVLIDEKKGDHLIHDMKYGEVDNFNKLVKDNRTNEKQQLDALDWFRYYCNVFEKQVMDPLKIKVA